MAVAILSNLSGPERQHGVGIAQTTGSLGALRLFDGSLQEGMRIDASIVDAFKDIDSDLKGDYRRIIERKGHRWVAEWGSDLREIYTSNISVVDAFAETFDYSRRIKVQHPDARSVEIQEAEMELGKRIFDDLAVKFAETHAAGVVIGDEDSSHKAWRVAFGSLKRDIRRHALEVVYGKDGNPVINHIWGIATEGGRGRVEQYVEMVMQAHEQQPQLFAENVYLTFIVPANSDIARISNEELERLGVNVVELPILYQQLRDFGAAMFLDDTPSSDSETAHGVLRRLDSDRGRRPVQNYKDGTL